MSLFIFLGALGALLYIFTAPEFTVQHVRVEGAEVLSHDDIIELVGAQNRSIWFVDAAQIAERLSTNAYIEDAHVVMTLPDQLAISIRERRPEVRWQSGGIFYLVDSAGRVLGIDGTISITNTLIIEDRSNQTLEPNDHVDIDALRLSQLLAWRLPDELHLQPASISWNVNEGVFVTTFDGRIIVFGQSDNLDQKLAITGALLSDGTAFTYLDLRSSAPYYRNDGGSQPPG